MSEEPPEELSSRQAVVLMAVAVEGGLILLAWALGWLLGQPPLRHFSWDAGAALDGVLAAVPMLLLFLAMVRWPVGPLRRIKDFSEQVLRPLLAPCGVLDMLGISVLAGLGEEMLFRGVLQGAFVRWLPPWLAVVLASTLFGLLHAVTASYAALAAVMGAYLGWLYLHADNLLAPAVTHALYDFLALLYLLRGPGSDQVPELPDEEEDEQPGE
jgi:membrane protease YdiL (CAAX protease family)